MCLTKCFREKRLAKKQARIQEQMNFVNEILNQRLQALKLELHQEIQDLEFANTKQEFQERIDNIEIILATKTSEDEIF